MQHTVNPSRLEQAAALLAHVKAHPATPRIGDVLMFSGLCCYALLMPVGRAFSEVGGALCLAGLLWTYLFSFQNAVLPRFPLWGLYALFFAFLLFKTVHSVNVGTSWYVFRTNIHKGFIFFPVAVECIRSRKRLAVLTGLLGLSAFIQGLDGIYQYIYGVDYLRDAIMEGPRLTASMGGGRVGNYMAMTVLPMLAAWVLLPRRVPCGMRAALTGLFLVPGAFLWIFAQARSGYMGLLAAALLLALLLGVLRLRHVALLGAVVCLIGFFGPERATFASVMHDIRLSQIWPSALEVFKSYFWLGVGNGAYRHGTDILGIVLEWEGQVVGFPHPHNIYVQLLAETGIVGTLLFALFTVGTGVWSLLRIRKGLRSGNNYSHWFMAALLWASYFGGYLVTAVGAHSYFRTWWLGTAMLILGSVVGACLCVSPDLPAVPMTRGREPAPQQG